MVIRMTILKCKDDNCDEGDYSYLYDDDVANIYYNSIYDDGSKMLIIMMIVMIVMKIMIILPLTGIVIIT